MNNLTDSNVIQSFINAIDFSKLSEINKAYYFEPVNLNQWNMFEKVKNLGHIEPFLATKEMHIGDIILLHVGAQKKEIKSGIYAIAEIVSEPFILEDSPSDYCNEKNTVQAKIISIRRDEPFFTHEECLNFINQFRTVHKIDIQHYIYLNSVLGKLINGYAEEPIFPDEISPESAKTIIEGAAKTVVVNSYERDKAARKKCINYYMKKDGTIKCQICGFDFRNVYGNEYDGLIHVHHVIPLSEIKKEYKVNPIDDLIPVCPNCHMALHSKVHPSVEELKNKLKERNGHGGE